MAEARQQSKTVVSVFGVKPVRIGGTETFARQLSSQLNERGWKSVLCFLTEPTQEVRSFLDLPNVSIEVLADATSANWSAIKNLGRILRRHRAELLHLHFTGFLGAYPWLARLLSVKKIFFTDHSSRPAGYLARRAPLGKRLAARLINWPVTKVICVSKYGENCLRTLDLLPADRHSLVYNAVDLSRVNAKAVDVAALRERFNIPNGRTVVVQVSWMIPEKGIPELLKTAKNVLETNPNVHFVLVGEGAHRAEFMRQAETMGISSHLTWTGLIADPFREGVFAMADIVCQLSDWEELFGWMIAEAMAHAKPVVATRVGGIPELVEEGVSGCLIPRGDTERAANCLNKLAVDVELRKKLGTAGRELVSSKFNLKQNVAQLVALYES